MNVAVDARSEGSYADDSDGWEEANTSALIEGATDEDAGMALRKRFRWSNCDVRERDGTLRSTLSVYTERRE